MPNAAYLTRFAQSFEADAGGFQFNGSGSISLQNGHALIHDRGAFTRFDGNRSDFGGGFETSVRVYLNADWSNGEGFNYSVAANNQGGTHRRDFAFHVSMDDGQLLIGVSTGSPATVMTDLELRPHVEIEESGWYTLSHSFQANEAGVLEVVLTVSDADGDVVFSQTISDPSDLIASEIGGNRYGWFTANTVEGGLQVDDVTLTTADTNPWVVKSGIHIVGTYATQEDAIAAIDGDEVEGDVLVILETGSNAPATFYVDAGMSIQAAIDAAPAGSTIMIGAGTFSGDLMITKELTIVGANAGVPGNGDRGAESVLTGQITINSTAPVTLDGVSVTHDGVPAGMYNAVYLMTAGHTVTNSTFLTTVSTAGMETRAILMGPQASGVFNITDNYIGGAFTGSGQFSTASWNRGIWSDGGGVTLNITGNVIDHVRSGMNLDSFNSGTSNVSGNTFQNVGTGISVGGLMDGPALTGIHDNAFSNASTDLNLQNIPGAFTFDADATNNVASDQLVIIGGTHGDTITGSEGADYIDAESLNTDTANPDNDTLYGLGGNDVLLGKDGDDTLDGGAGADVMMGGSGNDTFIADGADTLDGGDGVDTAIVADMAAAEAVTTTGVELLRDAEGNYLVPEGWSIQAVIDAVPAGSTIVIGAGTFPGDLVINKSLNIVGANDGVAGDGERGAESVITGGVRVTADDVSIDGVHFNGAGFMEIGLDRDYSLIMSGSDISVTNSVFTGSAADTRPFGAMGSLAGLNFSGNLITGWAQGAYIVNGTAGTISGNVFIGNGNGIVTESAVMVISGNSFTNSTGSHIALLPTYDLSVDDIASGNTFLDPEARPRPVTVWVNPGASSILGGDGNETINAEYVSGPVSLDGGEGDDLLVGSAGADSLNGGEGDDVIVGGAGADAIDGGDGHDTVHFGSGGNVVVDFEAGTITQDGHTDTISGIENVTVGDGVTLVTAFDANNLPDEVVELEGTGEFDTLNIQVANLGSGDIVRMESGGDRVELDLDGDGQADMTVSGMEEIVLNGQHIVLEGDFTNTGLSDDTVIMNGTGANDILDGRLMTSTESIEAYGNAGNDLIYGAGGEDLFDGGAGSDNIYGGAGDDVFIGTVDGVGDNYRGELGTDTVDYSAATSAMNINLNNSASGVGVGTDQLFSIENAIGSAHNDTISGSSVDNRLTGGAGDDAINGNGGTDTVVIDANATSGMAVQGSFRITVTSGDGVDVLRNVEFIQFDNALIQVNGSTGNAYAYGADDIGFATENCGGSGNVLCNDIEIENEAMTVTGGRAGLESAGGAMDAVDGDGTQIVGEYGTLTLYADGSYSYEVTDETLSAGQVVHETFTYHVQDAAGEGSDAALMLCVMGNNDGPTIVTASATGEILEDSSASASGSITYADVDALDEHTVSVCEDGPCYEGELTAEIVDGVVQWNFSVDPADIQHLASDETVTQTYTVTIRDGNGGCVEQTVTVTLEGTNDAPTGADDSASTGENTILNGSVAGLVDDVDGDGITSYQIDGEGPAGLSLNAETGAWSFDPGSNFDHLNVGDTATVTFSYTATDENGVDSEPATVTITVNGTNDGPVATTTEGEATEGVAHTGSVAGSDIDDDAVLTYSLASEAPASLTFNADGSYSIDTSMFDSLADGETATVVFDYRVTDEHDADSAAQTVTVTVTGTNDGPTVTSTAGGVTGSATEDTGGSFLSEFTPTTTESEPNDLHELGTVLDRSAFRIAANADLADSGLPSLAVNANLDGNSDMVGVDAYDWFTIELQAGETLYLDIDHVGSGNDVHVELYNQGGMLVADGNHSAPADAGDGAGEHGRLSFTALTSGTYRIRTDHYGTTGEPYTMNVSIDNWQGAVPGDTHSASGSFTYADLDTSDEHTVSVAGDEDYVGVLSASIDVDGTVEWEWNVDNDAIQFVAEGQTVTQTYTVTVSDGNGGSVPQTVTITITGENDSPVITGGSDATLDEDEAIADGISGTMTFSDVDLSDEHQVTYDAVPVEYVGDFSVSINEDGDVVWSLDIDDATLNALNEGDSIVQSYDVTVSDGHGGEDTRTVTITINGTDDGPVFTADDISADEDDYSAGLFTAVDPEDEGEITWSVVGETPTGFSLTSNGAWTYTATDASFDELETGESSSVPVTIRATDATGGYTDQVVTLTVDGVSYAPVATDVNDTVDEDSTTGGSVAATDAEDDAEDLTYELVGEGVEGLTFNSDGTYSFDAGSYDYLSGGETEVLEILYIARDSGGLASEPQTLTITVTGANDTPEVEGAGPIPLNEDDEAYEGTFSGSDAEGAIVSWAVLGEVPAGLTFDAETGAYTFDPGAYELEAGETETVTFQVTGTDEDSGVSEPATISFTITGVNDAPVAADHSDSLGEDDQTSGQVTATDDDSDTVTFALVGEGPEGLEFNSDGTWTFDASSYDSLSQGEPLVLEIQYVAMDDEEGVSEPRTLTITITGSNDTPEVDSDTLTIDEGDSTGGSVAGTDVDGEVVTYTLTSETPAGLDFNSDGTWTFDSSGYEVTGETQTVTFTYTGTDDSSGLSEPGSVTITINAVNDAPIASEDTVNMSEDSEASGILEASDVDGTVVSWNLVGEAPAGLTWGGDGTWSFDARGLYEDMDDGDTDQVVVTYTVTDDENGVSEERTLTLNISGVNDAPVGADSDESFDEDTVFNGSVSSTDAEDDAVTYSLVDEAPSWLTFNSDGTYSIDGSAFLLAQGANAVASFDYVVNDGDDTSEPATVSINVNGVNDAPTAGDLCDDVTEDSTIYGSLVSGLDDEDSSTEAATFALVGEVPTGLSIDADTGAWTFDASSYDDLAEGEEVTVYATYTITDGESATSNEGTLAIHITGSNDGPVAELDSDASVEEGDTLQGQVSATDVDSEGLTYSLVNEGPTGLTFNSDGSYSFDTSSYAYLNLGQTAVVSFTFIASDEEGAQSEQSTVTITVQGAANVVEMLDGGDTFMGTGADEDVTGGDSDDFINAGGGANTVHGGEGDDQIFAGSGNDDLNGDAGDDTINAGSGNDVIRGGAGNDFVNGGSGDDYVYSGAGDDDLRGGAALNDTVSFEETGNGITVNLSTGGFQQTGDGFDMITGFENVVGTTFADTIIGNSDVNILFGGEGNDTLDGAAGADTLIGADGNDWYYVDNAGDVIVDTSGTDRVSTTLATYALAAELENLYGQSGSGQHLIGNDGANVVAGWTGNDVLEGGLGGDTLIGREGNDILMGGAGVANTVYGGLGDDTYYVDANDSYIESVGEGTDSVFVSLNTHTLRANVENMTFSGTGNFTGTGNALNNSITGGVGNDTLMGGAGNDTLNGGDGLDVARLSGLASGYSITQEGAGWRVIDTNLGDGDDGNDFLTNIETLRFGNGVTQTLIVAPAAPAVSAKAVGPQILPSMNDDDFVYIKGGEDMPLVQPLSLVSDMDFGADALSVAGLLPQGTDFALHLDGDLGAGFSHGDDWML